MFKSNGKDRTGTAQKKRPACADRSLSETPANDEDRNRIGSNSRERSYGVAACANVSFVLLFLTAGFFRLPAISVKLAIVVSRLATMAA